MLSREHRLPYDRTLLSKEVLQGADLPCPIELHPKAFYREQAIELRLGCEVRSLDAASRTLRLSGDETLRYDACLVATGGSPKRLSVPGRTSGNLHLAKLGGQRSVAGRLGHHPAGP